MGTTPLEKWPPRNRRVRQRRRWDAGRAQVSRLSKSPSQEKIQQHPMQQNQRLQKSLHQRKLHLLRPSRNPRERCREHYTTVLHLTARLRPPNQKARDQFLLTRAQLRLAHTAPTKKTSTSASTWTRRGL